VEELELSSKVQPGADMQIIPFQSFQLGVTAGRRVDDTKRKEDLEKELDYYRGFLESLNRKLSNEKFVRNAKPEVVDLEKKKKSDTEEKIAAIEATLNA